jgi:hypothetical protein
MPLSEYEQRVLEEMEQQLRSDDPKLAKAISGGAPRRPLHVALGGVVVLAGIGLLFVGLYNAQIWLGLLGFVAMFGGVLLALRRPRIGGDASSPAPHGAPPARPRGPSLMEKLEERWDRRRDEDR